MDSEIIFFMFLIGLVVFCAYFFGLDQHIGGPSRTRKRKKHDGNEQEIGSDEADRKSTRKRINAGVSTSDTGLEKSKCIEAGSDEIESSDESESECSGFVDRVEDNEQYNKQNIGIFRSYVDENKLTTDMEKSGVLRALVKYIKENLEDWQKRKLNIAIIGNSGAGKSSLINAVRGVKANDEEAAPVGITETTGKEGRYSFPTNDNVVLWDLPGVGTQMFKREDYLSDVNISQFEIIIIVSATRFTEKEIWLAKKALQKKKNIFFVRTKVDIDLTNGSADHPDRFDEKKSLDMMKDEIKQNLKKDDIFDKTTEIYIVSSHQKDKYDFPEMFEKLKNLISIKVICMQKMLEKYVTKAVEKQKETRKGQFTLLKGLVLVTGFIPFDFRPLKHEAVLEMHNSCKKRFCIDDESLAVVSEEIGIPLKDLKMKHLKYFEKYEKRLSSWYNKKKLCAFHLGFRHFRDTLHELCDILAEDECRLIQLRIDKLGEQLNPLQ